MQDGILGLPQGKSYEICSVQVNSLRLVKIVDKKNYVIVASFVRIHFFIMV